MELLIEGTQASVRRKEIIDVIKIAIQKEKHIDYRDLMRETIKLEDALKEVNSSLSVEGLKTVEVTDLTLEALETFLDDYNKHIRSYSADTCLTAAVSAMTLKTHLLSTSLILENVLNLSLSGAEEVAAPRLELYLSNVSSLKDFSEKLGALSGIYTELLYLYGESESDYPIVLEHLESGSLWIKIAGHTLTATVLTSVLTLATNYYQEEFSKSGQLAQLPSSVKVIEDLLKLSALLEKEGIDTSEIKENIESSTKKISKKLDILLGDQPMVEINNIEKNIGDKLTQKMLEECKSFKIEHKVKV
jgi:hypothetical protein